MKYSFRIAAAAITLGVAALPALAADLPSRVAVAKAPIVFETFDPWMVRVRAIGVLPDSSAKVWVNSAYSSGSGLHVTNSVVPEVDISYFFTKNIAVEAICCITPHTIRGTGDLAGLQVGKTTVFPPTVMLQYHFTDLGAFKPYVGIGGNWTHYFDNNANNADGFTNLKLKDSFGVAAQIGVDYMINRNWGINVDVKRIMMRPEATVTLANVNAVRADVKIDPWVIGAGVTYRFGGK